MNRKKDYYKMMDETIEKVEAEKNWKWSERKTNRKSNWFIKRTSPIKLHRCNFASNTPRTFERFQDHKNLYIVRPNC